MMKERASIVLVPAMLLAVFVSQLCWAEAPALKKLKFASSARYSISQILPIRVAMERGFWKERGLDVEYVPFTSGGRLGRAMASGRINIAVGTSAFAILQATRGLPVTMISLLTEWSDWGVWVLPDSPLKKPEDLRGKKIGISRIGGVSHSFSKAAAKSLGLEKDVKMIAVGAFSVRVAALKTGAIDAFVQSWPTAAPLVVRGELRQLMDIGAILPKPWIYQAVIARKDFLQTRPDTARKAVQGVIKALGYILDNPDWTLKKIMALIDVNKETAGLLQKGLRFSKAGIIGSKAVENVRDFLIESGVIKAKEKVIPLATFFTNQFVR